MVDNIVVCVQQHIQVFDAMKILMNVRSFHSSVEMVERKSIKFSIYLKFLFKDALMKLVRIDVIVHQVGMDQHVRKLLIIVFLNHAIEMAHASIK